MMFLAMTGDSSLFLQADNTTEVATAAPPICFRNSLLSMIVDFKILYVVGVSTGSTTLAFFSQQRSLSLSKGRLS